MFDQFFGFGVLFDVILGDSWGIWGDCWGISLGMRGDSLVNVGEGFGGFLDHFFGDCWMDFWQEC